ncbi:MAG TPA: FAD-dependent oxidoreductase [Verrucomicrobiae bacterium]|nr:FAD-dependent oxidoreductase [Verrucomicrobiae bacterium]
MTYDHSARIAILGAGPAGLTAAECLRDRGYSNITILERSPRAGGKCYSIERNGRSYELGAGIVADSSTFIRGLAEKYDIPMERVEFGGRLYLDAKTGQPIHRSWRETLKLGLQLCRYWMLARRYRRIAEPGFANIEKDLCEPFAVWAKRHGIEVLAAEFANYYTGFGYGFIDQVSAAYVLKYYPWDIVFAYLKRSFYKFPNGIQGLWNAVAGSHHVLYNVEVMHVTRADAVRMVTNQGEMEFDALILAAPLDGGLSYLDASEEERALFPKIQHEDYRTYALHLRSFPRVTGYIPANMHANRAGHPVFWYQRFADSDLYTFYVFGTPSLSDDGALANIETVVKQLGGGIERVETVERWKFFPHVSPENLAAGFYDELESIQGRRHTFYVGELLNFSTVTHSAAYAKNLVERFF